MALTEQDLRGRIRRLEQLAIRFSIEEELFRTRTDVNMLAAHRDKYRAELRNVIQGLEDARQALGQILHRDRTNHSGLVTRRATGGRARRR